MKGVLGYFSFDGIEWNGEVGNGNGNGQVCMMGCGVEASPFLSLFWKFVSIEDLDPLKMEFLGFSPWNTDGMLDGYL